MDSFDITRLTDFDFESVCKDLFEEILGLQLELFSPGADQGVDLRHFQPDSDNSLIIQCKHWYRSGRPKLISHMRNKERPKIEALAPTRYILATSTELTKDAKDTLTRDLRPYVRTSADIYGLHEIVAELKKRPNIVKRHMRLWLSSTAVLQTLMTKEIVLRSSSLMEELGDALKTYVPNESLTHANEILETKHIVIISGIPGIGKTTLAQILAADYISQGSDLIEISEDIEEANRIWDDNVQQIFYYDDFLGQTTLEDKLHKNEDSRLLQLLRRIEKSPNKRLLLTTREYILNQARQRYEKMWHADFDPLKFVLDLGSYTTRIRAQILYNHIYFSQLPHPNKAIFANPDVHGPIIEHQNFNPRLISASLGSSTTYDETPEQTAARVYENVQHPRRIWKHLVENQLDHSAVLLLELLFSFGNDTPLDAIHNAFNASVHSAISGMGFRQAIKVLDGSVARTSKRGNIHYIGFHNPSVRDFMREYISDRPERLRSLIKQAVYFEQIDVIWKVAVGFEGSLIESALLSMSDNIEEALVRTLGSPNIHGRTVGYTANKVRLVLEISQAIGSITLQRYLFDTVLPNIDLRDGHSDGDEIASLVRELDTSGIPEANDWLERIVDQALDYATEDVGDWENATYADSIIGELEGFDQQEISLKVSDARSYVHDEMFRIASRHLENWPNNSFERTAELQEMVDFARQFANYSELFPTLDTISDYLTELQMDKVESSRPETADFDEEGISVQDIFGSLAEE